MNCSLERGNVPDGGYTIALFQVAVRVAPFYPGFSFYRQLLKTRWWLDKTKLLSCRIWTVYVYIYTYIYTILAILNCEGNQDTKGSVYRAALDPFFFNRICTNVSCRYPISSFCNVVVVFVFVPFLNRLCLSHSLNYSWNYMYNVRNCLF